MDIEKERISANFLMPAWLLTEHNARFNFATRYTAGKVIVDCACGNGTGTQIFAANAAAVHAFDISEEALEEARKKCNNPNTTFKQGSATGLPLADGFADVYVSLETIEHIPDDLAYLKEAARVVKTGGLFICSTPNRLVTNPGKTVNDKPANVFHVREYTEDEFVALLKRYFKKVEIHGQNPNSGFKVGVLGALGRFLPFHGAVRLHQLIKLLTHPLRATGFYAIQEKKQGKVFEYVTAVCEK
jgi:SAM-dependent methyltransferase